MTSRRSVWALIALGLIVALFFAYLYWREWWLERGFRRYRVSTTRDEEEIAATPQIAPRKPLVATPKPALPAPSNSPTPATPKAIDRPAPPNSTLTHPRTNWNERPPETTGPARGLVIVQADDAFHEIYVDDSFVGNAPARLNLVEGMHWIEIRKVGCMPYRRELQIISGAEVSLRTMLERSDIQRERCILPVEGSRKG